MKETNTCAVPPYLKEAFRQLSEMASIKARASELIKHSLEKGMSNESILREILRSVLPRKYGIGKGKVISPAGVMSRQCDIIIYDALNCPCIFTDENLNQVLPIEGVYAVVEVKTRLTNSAMKTGYELICSVKRLVESPKNVSTNKLIDIIPPLGCIVCYEDKRSLEAIYENYVSVNKKYNQCYSSLSYSKRSPGYADHTHENFLVEDVVVMNKGIVFYMYDGFPVMYPSGSDSLGVFIVGMLVNLEQIKLEVPDLLHYYGNVTIEYDCLTSTSNGYFEVRKPGMQRFPEFSGANVRRHSKPRV